MRLQAALSLLQLSTIEVYANALTPKFLRLAVTVQVIYDDLSFQLSLLKPCITGFLLSCSDRVLDETPPSFATPPTPRAIQYYSVPYCT